MFSVLIIMLFDDAERKAGRNTLMFLIGKTMASNSWHSAVRYLAFIRRVSVTNLAVYIMETFLLKVVHTLSDHPNIKWWLCRPTSTKLSCHSTVSRCGRCWATCLCRSASSTGPHVHALSGLLLQHNMSRFHAAVALADIWSCAYKPSENNHWL